MSNVFATINLSIICSQNNLPKQYIGGLHENRERKSL